MGSFCHLNNTTMCYDICKLISASSMISINKSTLIFSLLIIVQYLMQQHGDIIIQYNLIALGSHPIRVFVTK